MSSDTATAEALSHPLAGGRFALAVSLAATLAIVVAFADTALSMVAIWARSDVYTHGFLIVPVCVWLAWRLRAELSGVQPTAWWPGLLLVALSGFIWLLGSVSGVSVVEQLALVLMIQSVLASVLGPALVRVLAAPLLFLLFAVPFGEELVPTLIEWTADFTVAALRLTGIPVFREGNSFVIPSGQWSVIEACSGIRFLIISVVAGCLFAYLTYRSTWRRLAFVGVSVLAPIFANWLRAYLIVMLGHLTNNRLDAYIDHRTVGWILFGIVMCVVFWVGARYSDTQAARRAPATRPGQGVIGAGPHRPALVGAAALAVALAVVWLPAEQALASAQSARSRLVPAVEGAFGWVAVDADASAWTPRFGGQRASRRQTFERDGRRVVLHIAYYAGQRQNEELVNSENVLVAATDPHQRELAHGRVDLATRVGTLRARSATVKDTPGQFDVLWWYWVDGRTTTSDTVAKALLAWSRLARRSDDSAAVFLFTEPAAAVDATATTAAATLAEFAADMQPQIERALQAASGGPR